MLNLWSLFIEVLGSYSCWRVTYGIVPRVMGPNNFYLKFWANWNTSECCCVHHDLHLGSCGWTVRYAYGLYRMNVTWIFGLYYEDFSWTYFRMFLDQIFFETCLGTSAGLIKWNWSLQAHALEDLVCFVQYQLPYVSNFCWIRLFLACCFAFAFPFFLSTNCTVHVRKSMELDWTFWTQGSSECFFCFT